MDTVLLWYADEALGRLKEFSGWSWVWWKGKASYGNRTPPRLAPIDDSGLLRPGEFRCADSNRRPVDVERIMQAW